MRRKEGAGGLRLRSLPVTNWDDPVSEPVITTDRDLRH